MSHPRPFRFGVQLDTAADGAEWRALAREAEELGYSTLLLPDHFGDQLAPMLALTAAAEATTELRLGPLVLDNDYKHPVVTAKEAATLDLLSGGRLELGLGAGWMNTDYEQSGIPMDPPSVRIDRLEEAITVLNGLFDEGSFSFEGDHYRITEGQGLPKPVQRPRPPLLIGGGGPRVLALAAREADIVGVNPSIRSGRIDNDAARDSLATATDRKVDRVRKVAGDRYNDIEINFLVFGVAVTDDRQATLEAFAGGYGLEPEQLSDLPHAWIGTEDQICEQLVAGRERWDASYLVIQGVDTMRAAAPIVSRLSGT